MFKINWHDDWDKLTIATGFLWCDRSHAFALSPRVPLMIIESFGL